MKLTYTNPTGRIVIESEAADVKAAFETVAQAQEVFDEPACGCCQSANVRCDVRVAQGFKFYQLICRDCSARLDFGQHSGAETLFAKRKDASGQQMDHRGWYHYQGQALESDGPSPIKPQQPTTEPQKPDVVVERFLRAIDGALDETSLKHVVNLINLEITAKRIVNGRRQRLLDAISTKKAALVVGAGK